MTDKPILVDLLVIIRIGNKKVESIGFVICVGFGSDWIPECLDLADF